MRARGLDLRLVPPAAAAWLAAGLLLADPEAGWVCAAVSGLAAVAVGVIGFLRRSGIAGMIVVALAAIGVGAAATAIAGPVRHPPALDGAVSGHTVSAVGTVDSGARAAAGGAFGGGERVSFHVTVSEVDVGRTSITGRVPALVYASRARAQPRIGETVALTGTVKTMPPEDDVALTVYADSWRETAAPPAWLAWSDGLRTRFGTATAKLPGGGGELLPGIVIGDESRVSADLDADMKASSLSHLTAVSGSNCAVIIAGLLAVGAAAGLGRGARIAGALVGLAAFVVLVTPGASVLRAAVMAAIVVLGTALGRPGRALPALALAVLTLLVVDPWLARDYGFALSVVATAALLVLAPPLATRLERWLPRWLAVGLSVPLAAQLACQPVLVLLNPTVPLYGVIANVLAEPAAPIATVIGLIGCLVVPLSTHLAAPLLWAAWAPASWIAGIARTSTTLPASALPWPAGVIGFGVAVVLTLGVVALVARPRTVGGRRVRGAAAAASALLIVGVLALQAGPAIAARAAMPRDWVIGLCDIGQGDAIVLHSDTSYALIDTGPDPKPLADCMRELGIHHLALLVLTHYDSDHVGGLDAVVGMTGAAVIGTPPTGDAAAEHRVEELRTHHVPIRFGTRGDQGALGELRWQVLWPDGAHPDMSTSNEGGVALEIEGAGVRMLTLADLDEKAQDAMLSDGGLPSVDIVKVAHHGSADQSEKLYGLVHARLGLISCGAGNTYGHPTAKALQLLRAAGTQVARTDLEGTLLVTSHRGALALWSQKRTTATALWTPARR
ncbi:ComEC/Rec2 family competence protein [Gryllotalpicola daejeonensis]|uniref:ComEC/Rec2 family competence protein n=1 Tax=Gryllotalpicola daejeonensis TaxID=993087 RepID=A0ABP7ZFH5_9MICO